MFMRYTVIILHILSPMCLFDKIQSFMSNGVTVFAAAAHGDYRNDSSDIKLLRRELQESANGALADKQKLRNDRYRIYKDVSDAFEKYIHNAE